MQPITNIAFEAITSDYSWGRYGDFKVIIQMNTGYINATHLCAMATTKGGKAKQFGMWRQNSLAGELVNKVSASCGIPQDRLLIVPLDLPNDLRGTYAHPKLIPHIATWASVDFAIKVSDIVNDFLIHEAVSEKERQLKSKQGEIDDLTSRLNSVLNRLQNIEQQNISLIERSDQLLKTTNNLQEQNSELLGTTNSLKEQNSELLDTTKDLKEQNEVLVDTVDNLEKDNEVLNKNVEIIGAKLNVAIVTRVPPQSIGDREVMCIYARPRNATPGMDEMKVFRRKENTVAAAIRRLAAENYRELVTSIHPTPNAVDLWKRISDALKEHSRGKNPKVIAIGRCNFILRTEGDDLLIRDDIKKLVHELDSAKATI